MGTSISISWAAGITEHEATILTETVEQVLQWLYFRQPRGLFDPPLVVRTFGNWVIPALIEREAYWGTQWYIDMSYDAQLGRVIAPVFLELVRREPWQRLAPHYDLALLDQDLTDFPAPLARRRPDYYALGASFPGTAAVMSVYRLRDLEEGLRESALARLVRHHLGHVLAVPAFERRDHVRRRGLETHCTHRCVMRHASTVDELAAFTLEEADMDWPFCDQCTRDLRSTLARHGQNWN